MKTLKMFVMNDRTIKMTLRVQCASLPPWEGVMHTLEPAEGKMIEFKAEDSKVPYLKIWENNFALLSSVEGEMV